MAFITATQAKTIAFEYQDVDPTLIPSATILAIEEDNFKALLGNWYMELKTQYLADPDGSGNILTPANLYAITNYIQPALAYYIKEDFQLNQSFKTTNAGVEANKTGFGDPVAPMNVEKVRNAAHTIAEGYKNRLLAFITAEPTTPAEPYCKTDYPTYNASQNAPAERLRSKRVVGGFVFPDKQKFKTDGYITGDGSPEGERYSFNR